jgi:methionyl-tRNA synthetase
MIAFNKGRYSARTAATPADLIAAQELRAIWVSGNEYLQSAAPWATFKTDPAQAAMQIRMGLNLIGLYAAISEPFIPDASAKLKGAMALPDLVWPTDVAASLASLPAGHAFSVPDNLFDKIGDDDRADWETRFAGRAAD